MGRAIERRVPTVIVKVQRPIGSTQAIEAAPWLVYDRLRSFTTLLPPAHVPEHVKKHIGDKLTGYFNAIQQEPGWPPRLIFGTPAAKQDW